ncbi:hypothetical protein BN946_scf184597.g3 [Trametes cinnabarina]|uniref:Uncharacterized protein n=1 Tax=Pycnoporus cinnabarinus TaxID=5643 RepID=A0A060SCM0_PYCCI|nr:hypothetical protein BN946_scf184597.g3 [Trametes cinnabarina]
MPTAKGNITHYVCYGRKVGELEDMINAARQATHRDHDRTAHDGLEAGGEVPGLGAANMAPDPSMSAPYDTARDPDVLMMKLYLVHQALADKDNKTKLLNKQIKFLMQTCGMFADNSSNNEETNRQDNDNDGGRSRGIRTYFKELPCQDVPLPPGLTYKSVARQARVGAAKVPSTQHYPAAVAFEGHVFPDHL